MFIAETRYGHPHRMAPRPTRWGKNMRAPRKTTFHALSPSTTIQLRTCTSPCAVFPRPALGVDGRVPSASPRPCDLKGAAVPLNEKIALAGFARALS